jgi:endonuclease/exonuclease/phosphatase family metal-dependent hydrolase
VGGHEVTVRSVHPVAPMLGRHCLWHDDLTQLRATMAARPGPQVVAGDFNASRDHRPFRDRAASAPGPAAPDDQPPAARLFRTDPGVGIFEAMRATPARIDLSPGLPDLAAFPRAAWLRAEREVL